MSFVNVCVCVCVCGFDIICKIFMQLCSVTLLVLHTDAMAIIKKYEASNE